MQYHTYPAGVSSTPPLSGRAHTPLSENAFTEAVRQHSEPLFRHILFRVKNEETARDLLQTTWMLAWLHRERFTGTVPFVTWLRAIAKNAAINHRRGTGRTVSLASATLSDNAPGPDEVLDRKMTLGLIERAFDHVPDTYSQLLRLYYVEERPCREIATQANIPEDQVPAYLYKARWAVYALIGEM